jgi:hypothetical protein
MTEAFMPAANAKNPSQIELLSSCASMLLLPAIKQERRGPVCAVCDAIVATIEKYRRSRLAAVRRTVDEAGGIEASSSELP